jgi:cystathionine beta-lyase
MCHVIHNFDEAISRRGTDSRKYDPALCPDDVIPMWIADTDFRCPKELIDSLRERVEQGHFGYPYNADSFSQAVASWMYKRFGWEINNEWVDFAPGAVMPLLYGIRALSAPGDKILTFTPAYPPFYQLVENNGRQVVRSQLLEQNGRFYIDFENLEQGLKDARTRLMILCNPHNPTGRSFSYKELVKIGDLCKKHNVFILSDEIHCDIVYGGKKHIPFASLGEAYSDNCLIAINPSKTFNTAGLRTAAFICPNDNIRRLIIEQRMNNKAFGRPIFGALSVEVLYNNCEYYVDQLVDYLSENIKIVREGLKDVPCIKLIEPESTYLLWLDCRGLRLSQKELTEFFFKDAKLLLNDGQTFGAEGNGFMRMNVGCPSIEVKEAVRRIAGAVKKLKGEK